MQVALSRASRTPIATTAPSAASPTGSASRSLFNLTFPPSFVFIYLCILSLSLSLNLLFFCVIYILVSSICSSIYLFFLSSLSIDISFWWCFFCPSLSLAAHDHPPPSFFVLLQICDNCPGGRYSNADGLFFSSSSINFFLSRFYAVYLSPYLSLARSLAFLLLLRSSPKVKLLTR